MTMNMINNLNYPKPNLDDLNLIYEFEVNLVEYIINRQKENALRLYDRFFSKEFMYTNEGGVSPPCIQHYIISLSLLVCHSAVKNGVSPYSAKSKCHAFSKLLAESKSNSESLDIGRMMVQAYIGQISSYVHKVDNIYIRSAINYIHDNLGTDLTLNIVSMNVGLSRCYFCSQFKKELKMSFTDYLAYARIEKSKFLLCNSTESIIDIAVSIGFNSQSYFTTQFKKHTGKTPKEFREKGNLKYSF